MNDSTKKQTMQTLTVERYEVSTQNKTIRESVLIQTVKVLSLKGYCLSEISKILLIDINKLVCLKGIAGKTNSVLVK